MSGPVARTGATGARRDGLPTGRRASSTPPAGPGPDNGPPDDDETRPDATDSGTSGVRPRVPSSKTPPTTPLVFPAVLGLSLVVHALVLGAVALLPPPSYASSAGSAELEFQVLDPVDPEPEPIIEPEPVEPEPEPVVEPEPEPVVRPEPVAEEPPPAEEPPAEPPPAEPPPAEAPPPPAEVLTGGEAGPGDDFVMPPGEPGGVPGGTPGGTGDTVGAQPVEPAPQPAPERRGISRAELRRRLVGYIRNTLHGYVNERIRMPLVARREHLEGTAIVRIRLAEDGRILGARLSRSSGHGVLDDAAVESIRALGRVPAPPADIPWDPDEELPLPVRYQIR